MKFIEKLKEMTSLRQRIVLSGIAVFYIAGAALTIYIMLYS